MPPVIPLVILAAALLAAGCSTIPETPSPVPLRQDPIIGVWASNQPGSTMLYRFWENETFSAWSDTGDIHPKHSFQYSGRWELRGLRTYVIEGAHIGYGDVTPLAIWRELTIVYDPLEDTFSITVYSDQKFIRLSHDPDSPVP